MWKRVPDGTLSPPLVVPFPGSIHADSTLATAIHWFAEHLYSTGYSEETARSYLTAIALFAHYAGARWKLSEIEKAHISGFLDWIRKRRGRGKTSTKTIEIRGTAVRCFFAALVKEGVLKHNPAKDVYPPRAQPPWPEVLFDKDVDQLYQTAARLIREEPPKTRPYLLLTLALGMGLRLGEIERLTIADVDLSDPYRPVVHVRYETRIHKHKIRALVAPPDFTTIYHQHLETLGLSPVETINDAKLFPVTQRWLEYEIRKMGELAGLPRKLTARTLRWTWAVRKVKRGVSGERLRRLMGLSPIGFEQVKETLAQLASPPLE